MGYEIASGTRVTERARVIKSDDEIEAHAGLHLRLRGGHGKNARGTACRHQRDGAVVDSPSGEHRTRRASGSRPGFSHPGAGPIPWFREASSRLIRAGELVGLDTDLVGPFGYCADISRTWFCGPGTTDGRAAQALRAGPRADPVQHRHSRAGHEFRRGRRKIMARSGGIPGSQVRHRRSRGRPCRRVPVNIVCGHAGALLDRRHRARHDTVCRELHRRRRRATRASSSRNRCSSPTPVSSACRPSPTRTPCWHSVRTPPRVESIGGRHSLSGVPNPCGDEPAPPGARRPCPPNLRSRSPARDCAASTFCRSSIRRGLCSRATLPISMPRDFASDFAAR